MSLDAIEGVLARSERIERWQRERFYAKAAQHVQVLGIQDRRGNRFYIHAADPGIGRDLFLDGSFDAERLDSAHAVLRDHGIAPTQVLDVGANIGTSTIGWLDRLPGSTVVAFEPEPANCVLLEQAIAANGLRNRVRVHQIALGNQDGSIELELAEGNPGDHRVRCAPPLPGTFGEPGRTTITVPIRRLDSIIDRGDLAIDSQTLVCIDVQGHEWHVLDGASRVREVGAPVTIEFWPYALRRGGRLQELVDLLANYTIFDITTRPRRTSVADIAAFATTASPPDALELLLMPRSSADRL